MRFFSGPRAGLRLFLLVGFAGLSPVSAAHAQTIVHVDPPDIVLTSVFGGPGAGQDIYIEGDSDPDFSVIVNHHPGGNAFALFWNSPQLKYVQRDNMVDALVAGTSIGPGSSLGDTGGTLRQVNPSGATFGKWTNGEDRFVGFLLEEGRGAPLWGWARLNVNVSTGLSQVTIKDWAYRSGGQAIVAGDTGAGNVVPEPGALALFLPALAVVGVLRKRAKAERGDEASASLEGQ